MKIISYNPGMQITNTDQLARGTGAKYLEVLDNGAGLFIAVGWRTKLPTTLPSSRALIQFSSRKTNSLKKRTLP